jgi:Protein of unknown function (DUF2971)
LSSHNTKSDTETVSAAFEPGDLLWHYTGFSGLQGILNGTIWASNAAYLNDAREIQYAIGIAAEVFDSQKEQLRFFRKYVTAAFEVLMASTAEAAFVASFSRNMDDLSQWRAYGGSGPSFAIGFDPIKLQERGRDAGFELKRVTYSRSSIERAIRTWFGELDDFNRINKESFQKFSEAFSRFLLPLVVSCKHESFSAEDEWRLVRGLTSDIEGTQPVIKFRESKSLVVPYVEVPLHKPIEQAISNALNLPNLIPTPIVVIGIGPSPHQEILKQSVGAMARTHGINALIDLSSTPFRNW